MHAPNLLMLAQIVMPATVAQWAIVIIIAMGVIGIAVIVIRQTGVQIPPFIVSILWILLAVVIGILAIKFIVSIT